MSLIVILIILNAAITAVVPESKLREKRSPQYYARPPPPPPPHDGWRRPPPDGRRTFYSENDHRFKSIEEDSSAPFKDSWESSYRSEYWRPPRDHDSRPPPPPPPPPDDYSRPPPPPPDHHGRHPPYDDYGRRPPPDDRYGRPPPHDHGGPPSHHDYGRPPPHYHGGPPPHHDYGRPPPHDHGGPPPHHDYGRPPPHDDFDRPPYDQYGRRSPPPPPPPEIDYSRTYSDQRDRQPLQYNGRRPQQAPSQYGTSNDNKPRDEYTPMQKTNRNATNEEEENLIRYIERIFKDQYESTTASQAEIELFKDLSSSKHSLKYSLHSDKEKETRLNDNSESIQYTETPHIFDVRDGFRIENTGVFGEADSEKAEPNDQSLSKNPPAITRPFIVPLFQAVPVTPQN